MILVVGTPKKRAPNICGTSICKPKRLSKVACRSACGSWYYSYTRNMGQAVDDRNPCVTTNTYHSTMIPNVLVYEVMQDSYHQQWDHTLEAHGTW